MTDTCSCPPGDCHGGHTINVDPQSQFAAIRDELDSAAGFALPPVTDDYLRAIATGSIATTGTSFRLMAAELLALRARIPELEAEARCRPWSDFKTICQVGQELADLHARAAELERERDEARAAAGRAHGEAAAASTRATELAVGIAARDKRITELEAAQREVTDRD